jgi:hypothetical protein
MLDRAVEVLEKDPQLDDVKGVIAESGELSGRLSKPGKKGRS